MVAALQGEQRAMNGRGCRENRTEYVTHAYEKENLSEN
jgi:hypothetical protein